MFYINKDLIDKDDGVYYHIIQKRGDRVHAQIKPLCEVAQVIPGIADERDTESGIRYYCFQPNSFNELGEFDTLSTIMRKSPLNEGQLVHKGDIFVKRLNHNYPFLVKDNTAQTVVSTNLFIVRPRTAVHSAYLAFLFEQPGVIEQIAHFCGSASGIKAVSAKMLMEISVQLVDLDKQVLLGNLWLLNKRRKKLLNEYKNESDRLLHAVAERFMK